MNVQTKGLALIVLFVVNTALPALAQLHQNHLQQKSPYADPLYRKFVSKPNNIKKQNYYYPQKLQGIEKNDYNYGTLSSSGAALAGPNSGQAGALTQSSFDWGSTLNMVLQFIMGTAQAFTSGTQIDKIDSGDGFSWAKVISIGMQVLLNVLGGGSDNQIEKNDDPTKTAMQGVLATVLGLAMGDSDPDSVQIMAKQATELFSVIMSLVDALKTSFSERSVYSRSLGQNDITADTALAAITMMEGMARNYLTEELACNQKSLCLASRECSERTSASGYMCQLAGYAASYMTAGQSPMHHLTDAVQNGRQGVDCHLVYSSCHLF